MDTKYCGIDLHKRFSTVCIMNQAGEILEERKLMHRGGDLKAYFAEKGHMKCVVEPMDGWGWLSDYLESCGHEVHLANPYKVKLIAESRVKTDKVDARILAQLMRLGYLPESYVAGRELRDRRSFLRYRMRLVQQRTRHKNQIHRLLRMEGIESPEVTDLFGRAGRTWLEEGCCLRPVHERIKQETLQMLDQTATYTSSIDRELKKTVSDEAKRLMTIPGIGILLANVIMAEAGDIRRFPTPKHFAGYTGLVCSQRSSGGRERFGKITKQGNRILRWTFVEAAQKARFKDPHLRSFFDRIATKKGSGRATVALARKLAEITWHVWMNKKDYDTNKTRRRFG
jgi:transposase